MPGRITDRREFGGAFFQAGLKSFFGLDANGFLADDPMTINQKRGGDSQDTAELPFHLGRRQQKGVIGDLRVVLTVLKANSRIDRHKADGRISVQTIEGHIRMHALGKEYDLARGHLLTLERGATHDVEAVEDSAFLLTIARPTGGR